jgi:uncharacterized protein involved in exopolysaccharide biosynthesis
VSHNDPSPDPRPASSLPPLVAMSARLPTDELTILEFLNVILRRWRIVTGLPLAVTLLVAVVSFLIPATYTATTTFVPEVRTQGRLPAGLAGLAGQFGVSLGAEATQSPLFYAEVVKSREVMERILLSEYQDPRSAKDAPDSSTLLRILRVKGRDNADSLHRGVKALDNLVAVRVDKQTNIVTLNVDAPYPTLAAAVANRFVSYLNDFNAKSRQSQARERRKFIEQRLADGERELRASEEDLRSFYERNRSWQQSPQLAFEEGRLRRQVEIRQDVYLTLRREYETARIEEVNDTPVITVIDQASPPQQRSRPKRILLIVLAFLLGGIVAVFWAAGAEYFDRARRENDRDYREFSSLLKRMAQSVSVLRPRA